VGFLADASAGPVVDLRTVASLRLNGGVEARTDEYWVHSRSVGVKVASRWHGKSFEAKVWKSSRCVSNVLWDSVGRENCGTPDTDGS
jgi:hypothetical protein